MTADLFTLTREADEEENEEWLILHAAGQEVAFAAVIHCAFGLWIAELAVHRDYQRQGLAGRLLDTLISEYPDDVLALSCETFQPDTWPRGGMPADDLAAWYRRRGFQPEPIKGVEHRMVRCPSA
ncbi:GNAT family N-acetyltransferase [Streptomyces bauhiniae]|uniref:GNAT family N-acetyltransferase n=1 Tax=Streptomyces bauhiniae TaxID=2340725 RepID=UPI0033B8A4EA